MLSLLFIFYSIIALYCIIMWITVWSVQLVKQMILSSFKTFFFFLRFQVYLTSSILSSSISLNTVPLIWLGFSATQLNTGIRNLVLMGFLIFTATQHNRKKTCQQHHANKHAVWSTEWCGAGLWTAGTDLNMSSAHLWGYVRGKCVNTRPLILSAWALSA